MATLLIAYERRLEIGTGNYSPAPHCERQAVLHDRDARARWLESFEWRDLVLCALNLKVVIGAGQRQCNPSTSNAR